MSEDSTLAEAISNTMMALMENLHTCMPGRIESYDFKRAQATVKPLIQKSYIDGDTLILPVLTNVPVIFPRTSKAGITFPIKEGDRVLLVFSERSLDKWYSNGADAVPGDNRKFDLSDAICIPGLYSFNNRNIASNNTDLEVQNDGQKITIKSNGDIDVGTGLLTKLVNDTFMSVFNTHTHVIPTSIPTVPPGVAPTATPLPVMTALNLTDKVKAQ